MSRARVHIVMPDRAMFAPEARKATAAVTVKTRGRLPSESVQSIRHLVASSVPELSAESVSIIDQTGALLARAGFSVALKSDKIFNRIVAAGITAWFLVQGLINIMVVLHLLPVLGVPLPFVSYGGSALLANLLGIGVLLALARDTPEARRHIASRRKKSRPRMTSVLAAGGR